VRVRAREGERRGSIYCSCSHCCSKQLHTTEHPGVAGVDMLEQIQPQLPARRRRRPKVSKGPSYVASPDAHGRPARRSSASRCGL
jgi:hypothetical protein